MGAFFLQSLLHSTPSARRVSRIRRVLFEPVAQGRIHTALPARALGLDRLRFIASGGALKNILRETEETEQDLLLADEDGEGGEPELFFDWRRAIKRYVKR
jgi:hypothetical protein